MKFIGITGGVGSGKSTILAYLRKNYRVRTLIADEVAHDIMEPGYDCYVRLQKEFAQEKIWLHNGRFNRQRLAEIIFADDEKRERLNSIVHPAVKEYILKEVERERRSGSMDYVVLEAALLIEDGYDKICDELWYVFVTEENRRKRLIENRGYSDEKIAQMFAAQLPEGEYRRHCQVIIDNNGPIAQVYLQLAQLLNDKGDRKMQRVLGQEEDTQKSEIQYVFGLDIGTRNVVGTVGYKKEKEFIVVAQYAMEHETRAMLDGQIHDIGRVGRTISIIKEKLEDQIGQELTEVCIAAAGRVLKTVTTYVEYEFPEETVVTGEHIHTLELLGVDKAAQELKEANDTKYKFYCVGYSVMKYYINDEIFSNIESHKADVISAKIIVTFLPEDVVDGLYMAVGFAGLTVANMTLEPIAAIDVAIPENFRMLNIALVDVGAGTSDISLTRDGSIIAYGMIPFAGDELTEMIVQHYLVDFKMAEHIKLSAASDDEIEFEDIMSLKHTITAEEVWKLTEPLVDKMSTDVANKIIELNGDQSVSATFIVGGGGKIHGFDEMLAKKLELPQERVALRGEEVLKEVTFLQDEIVKDPLLVTPIGICLNYYEQKNNFIMVRFNGERLKLYDNNKLTIVDAAIQAGFPNDQLFPKRGREINFTVNGRPRIVRGDAGEAAIIRMNDRPASINTPIEPNCEITIEPSTAGREAHYMVGQLEEYHSSTITFEVNHKLITCPRYVEVNGILEPPTYEIKENDAIVTRSFYTVEQLAEFMDVELDMDADILVNNRVEDLQALVYENFSVDWKVISYRSTPQDVYPDAPPKRVPDLGAKKITKKAEGQSAILSLPQLQDSAAGKEALPEIRPQNAAVSGTGQPGTAGRAAYTAEPHKQEEVFGRTDDVFGKKFTDMVIVPDAGKETSADASALPDRTGQVSAEPGRTAVPERGETAVMPADVHEAAGAGKPSEHTAHMHEPSGKAPEHTAHMHEPSGKAPGHTAHMHEPSGKTSERTSDQHEPSGKTSGYTADQSQPSGKASERVSGAYEVSGKTLVNAAAVSQSSEKEAVGVQLAEKRQVEIQPSEKAAGAMSGEVRPADSMSGEVQPAENMSGKIRPVENMSENVSGEVQSLERMAGEARPAESVTVGIQPAENMSGEAQPSGKTADNTSEEVPPSEKTAESVSREIRLSDNISGEIRPAERLAGGIQAADNASAGIRPAQSVSAGIQPSDNMSGEIRAAETVSGEIQAAENVSGEVQPAMRAAGISGTADKTTEGNIAGAAQQPKEAPGHISDAHEVSEKMPERAAGTDQPFQVVINGETVTLKNKKEFIFVDIFEHISFDLSQSRGRMLKTEVNGADAQYTQLLQPGDKISIYWKENE